MYSITDLGTATGSPFSAARSINASGQIVGTFTGEGNSLRSFLYSDGKFSDTTASGSNGAGINDSDRMTTGNETAVSNTGYVVGVRYTSVGSTPIATTPTGSNIVLQDTFKPRAVNDQGQIVGDANNAGGFGRPFLYSDGKVTYIGLLPNASGAVANAINSKGQVVGGAFDGGSHPFLFDKSGLHDLGTLGGTYGAAYGINNSGQIVGDSSLTGDLPGSGSHAFLYGSGKILDLNDLLPPKSGWMLETATAINDSGQIVGYGTHDGTYTAFRLDPVTVPEPTALAMSLVLASAAALKRMRRAGGLR